MNGYQFKSHQTTQIKLNKCIFFSIRNKLPYNPQYMPPCVLQNSFFLQNLSENGNHPLFMFILSLKTQDKPIESKKEYTRGGGGLRVY